MLIDSYLPTYDVRDYHQVRVEVPAGTAYSVLRSFDRNRSWNVQMLLAIHSLSSRVLRIKSPPLPSGIFLEQALAVGCVILEEGPGRSSNARDMPSSSDDPRNCQGIDDP